MRASFASRAKSVASEALGLLAIGLGAAARAAERSAHQLRSDGEAASEPSPSGEEGGDLGSVEVPSAPGSEPAADDGPRREPTVEAAPGATEPASRPATVIADLANRPAREVIDEVDRLSTDELRRLLDHERASKRRKTVIEAIERAVDAHQGS